MIIQTVNLQMYRIHAHMQNVGLPEFGDSDGDSRIMNFAKDINRRPIKYRSHFFTTHILRNILLYFHDLFSKYIISIQ